MLVLIQMQSPVAAEADFDVSVAYAQVFYPGSGPPFKVPQVWWAGANPPGSYRDTHSGGAVVHFKCSFVFRDTGGNNSRHYGELNVQRVSPTTGPLLVKNTGNRYPNGGEIQIDLQIIVYYNVNDLPITWDVWVYIECELIVSPYTTDYDTFEWDYTMNP